MIILLYLLQLTGIYLFTPDVGARPFILLVPSLLFVVSGIFISVYGDALAQYARLNDRITITVEELKFIHYYRIVSALLYITVVDIIFILSNFILMERAGETVTMNTLYMVSLILVKMATVAFTRLMLSYSPHVALFEKLSNSELRKLYKRFPL